MISDAKGRGGGGSLFVVVDVDVVVDGGGGGGGGGESADGYSCMLLKEEMEDEMDDAIELITMSTPTDTSEPTVLIFDVVVVGGG